ncbi:MAG: sirohydrochlorin chelatase [Frankiales bacterium]|nr:sirohydrochlorin chelatase [Frankiales bacterium]
MTAGVLLAHGSPDPRSGHAVRDAADRLAALRGSEVAVAFLEHDRPTLAEAVAPLEGPVAVLPLLLSSAYHLREDVPAAVRAAGRPVHVADAVGHPPDVLDLLLRRAAAPAVVVAAGTRRRAEREAFARAVAAASRRTGVVARAAFATGPGPRLDDAVPGRAVVPWLLAPGRLLDRVRDCAARHEQPVVGDGLLAEPAFLAVLDGRLQDASVAPRAGVAS